MWQCRSPRMSLDARSAPAARPRAPPRARRGSRAARAGCTACRAARRPPPRSRTRACRRGVVESRRTRDTCRPRLHGVGAQRLVVLPEPVKCWSRLPKFSGGTMRRSTRDAVVRDRLARRRRRVDCTSPISGSSAERRRRAPPGRWPWRRCRGPCSVSAQRRALPAISTRSDAGCSRSASTSSLGDRERLREQQCAPSAGRRRRRRAHRARSPRPWRRSP